jgi:hypothetical protein
MKRFTKITYCTENGKTELLVLKPNGKATLSQSYHDYTWPELLELADACRAAAEELRSLHEVAVGADEE